MLGLAACAAWLLWGPPAVAQEIADSPAYEIPEDYQPEQEAEYEVEAPTDTEEVYQQVESGVPAEPYYQSAPPEPPQVQATDDYYHVLAPYGRFHRTSDGLIWVPRRSVVGAHFVPYMSAGNWVNSNHGLMFVSDWNWGWLPFHYGRWFRHPRHGWSWVHRPGWSPAWVRWRHGGGYVGWVPEPPGRRGLPHRYWAFASPRRMVQGRAWRRYVVPRHRWRTVMHTTRPWRHRARLNRVSYYRSPSVRISGVGVVHVAPPRARGALYRVNVRNGRASFRPWRRRGGRTVVHTGPGGRVRVRTTRGGRAVTHTGRGNRVTVRQYGPGGQVIKTRAGGNTVVRTGPRGAVKIRRRGRHGMVTTTVKPGRGTVVKRTRRGPRGRVQQVTVTKRKRGKTKTTKVKASKQGGKKRRRRSR